MAQLPLRGRRDPGPAYRRRRVTYSREMRFADPSLLGSFSDLLQLEMKNLQDYFEKTDD